MQTKRATLVTMLMVALSTVACASRGTPAATSEVPVTAVTAAEINALAGKWHGWLTERSGYTVPVQVDVSPDGTYASRIGTASGSGAFRVVDGKILTSGHLSGPQAPVSDRTSVATLVMKNGRPMLVGEGHTERGPYSYELTRD